FVVVGGFDNEGKGGCDTENGPEKKIDLKATYPVKGREAAWHHVSEDPVDGYIDLSNTVRPSRETVAYALTYLEADHDKPATLALGTSGAYRLWVNGQLAGKSDDYHPARPDQARISLKLARGQNK